MLSLRNTIQLNQDVACGPGKLSVYAAKERHGDSYAALVHAGLVELMLLDREGNILQKDTLTMEDLNSDKISEIQVMWCAPIDETEEPLLILAQSDQLLRVAFDRSASVWKANLNAKQPGRIATMATIDRWIYAGGSDGLWELESQDLEPKLRLSVTGTVTAISVSHRFLVIGHEDSRITVFAGRVEGWTMEKEQSGHRHNCCCTSLLQANLQQDVLLAAYSNGTIRAFSLPQMELMSETVAHARWIARLMPLKDGFVSAAEDGFLHLWRMKGAHEEGNDENSIIRYVDSLQLKDGFITGGETVCYDDGDGGAALLVTVYDQSQLYWLAAFPNDVKKD